MNWNDLLIKGVGDSTLVNGYDNYHVRMGDGFIAALEGGIPLKDSIVNDVRSENGVRMLVSKKKSSRSVNLKFNIHGATRSEYMEHKTAFENMLMGGLVDIKVNDTDHPAVYHLVYTGKSVTYSRSYNGTFGQWVASFTEPNPDNRTATQNAHVKVMA